MKEPRNNVLNFCLGVFDSFREKMESLFREMAKRGEIRRQENPEAVEKIIEKVQREQEALFDKIKLLIQKVITEMKLARTEDLEAIQKHMSDLEEEIRNIKDSLSR